MVAAVFLSFCLYHTEGVSMLPCQTQLLSQLLKAFVIS